MAVEVASRCTCNTTSFHSAQPTCLSCGRPDDASLPGRMLNGDDELDEPGASVFLPRLIAGFISGALTGVFAIAGAFTGAVTGALAGRGSDSGILRRAGLGAVAGAVLSIEVLEASRAYWCSDRTTASSSMADFIEELLHSRLVQEHVTPTMSHFQVSVPILEIGDENIYDIFWEMSSKGLSDESLKKLPCHEITNERSGIHGEDLSCTVCLQDIVTGETVRTLPLCSHTFHLRCIDKWLVAKNTCPVCRQYV
ncbi:RING/U-box superfamily protein [Rhynchospora pubera]|uniref:RING/U-box superfamily protein n=1 Tax=Rhynchospora pubera TaxID=906938 RepID=A0AAV8CRP0_9POAL|nr:RING/U-box superfamily protein [Rhynchospora pubera]